MFLDKGECYHTGYIPTFRTPVRITPRAIIRSRQFVVENRDKWEIEDNAKR